MSTKSGRPSKIFNSECVDSFLNLIEVGNDFNIAADSAGISRSTVFEWLSRGREARISLEAGNELSEKDNLFLDFLERFMRARSALEVKAVETISKSLEKGSWRAAAWFLENRFPERWSSKRLVPDSPQPSESASISEIERKIAQVLKLRGEPIEN